MANILQIMDYSAVYRGNFIPSIEALETEWLAKNSTNRMAFMFPNTAKECPWMADFMQNRNVYFTQCLTRKIRLDIIKELKSIVNKENIDIIHTHFVSTKYLLPWWILNKKPIRVVFHAHGEFKGFKGHSLVVKCKRWIMNEMCDIILGCSDFVAESIKKHGIIKPQVVAIPNAIQFERMDNYEKVNPFPIGYDKIVMMFGWPYRIKGCDRAIRIVQKIREQGMNVLLAIGYSGRPDELNKEIMSDFGYIPNFVTCFHHAMMLQHIINMLMCFCQLLERKDFLMHY